MVDCFNSGVADNGSPGNVVANDLWNNTAPTSSVVTLGSYNGVNDSGDDYIKITIGTIFLDYKNLAPIQVNLSNFVELDSTNTSHT